MVAGRIAVELSIEVRYKLRMLGVPIIGATTLFGDNQSMIHSTTVPSSILKKKHNAIGYHRVREAIAGRIVEVVHVPTEANLADILTKALPGIVHHRLLKHMKPLLSQHKVKGECREIVPWVSPSYICSPWTMIYQDDSVVYYAGTYYIMH
jgi:hypothetical protein